MIGDEIMTPAQEMMTLLGMYAFWVNGGGCIIKNKSTNVLEPMRPTFAQSELTRVALRQAQIEKPIRILVPKSRRLGVSTWVQSLFWYLCKRCAGVRATTFAHNYDETRKIFDLARRIHMAAGLSCESRSVLPFGSGLDESIYECRTAGGWGVGAGTEGQFQHYAELAKCERVAEQGEQAIKSAMNVIERNPFSIIVGESTGEGPFGVFYDMCMDAKAGNSTFELVFFPWFRDPYAIETPPPEFEPKARHAELMLRFNLTREQIYWYALKEQENAGDGRSKARLSKFLTQFPSILEECFIVATGRVYAEYSDMPLEHGGHVGRPEGAGWRDWDMYGGMDYGSGDNHPNVFLWAAHNPAGKPRIIVDPACVNMRKSFMGYRRNPDTGDPIKGEGLDDCADVCRYIVTTLHLQGTLYIFREYVEFENPPYHKIAATIKSRTSKPLKTVVFPQEQPKTRGMYAEQLGWDCIPWTHHVFGKGNTKIGTVEDGITWISAMLSGDVVFFQQAESKLDSARRKLREAWDGKDLLNITLTDDEKEAVAMQREADRREMRDENDSDPVYEMAGWLG